jgi:hypothetical protein
MSNVVVVMASSRSVGPRPGVCAIERRKLAIASLGMATPFGRPVEPEVNRT